MKHSTRLADLLQSTFGLHRARVTCLAALVIALFRVKTVNLAQLATAFPGTAEVDSHYRPLQRFFQHVQLQPARVAKCARFSTRRPLHPGSRSNPVMLGKIPINFLVLSVVHHDGIAFPLFFRVPESSSGQALEKTRLREAKRLETLGGVLAIAFCWA